MAFREVAVTEIREVLRAWLSGAGLRKVAEQAGVDRKTARRYVAAAAEAGLARDGARHRMAAVWVSRANFGRRGIPRRGCTRNCAGAWRRSRHHAG